MSNSVRTVNKELTDFSVAIAGNIDLELAGEVKRQLEALDIKQ
jgi:hypothetical protein